MSLQTRENTLFILGSGDPEMNVIKNILLKENLQFQYAVDKYGKRVRPHTVRGGIRVKQHIPGVSYIVLIESDMPKGYEGYLEVAVIDHHPATSDNYHAPPSQYWGASSLGQFIAYIGSRFDISVEVSENMKVIAASDHCIAAAYRGECDVDAEMLYQFRLESKAAYLGVTSEEINTIIKSTMGVLINLPHVDVGAYSFIDARGVELEELFESAMILKLPVMFSGKSAGNTSVKVGIIGASSLQMESWISGCGEDIKDIHINIGNGMAAGIIKV